MRAVWIDLELVLHLINCTEYKKYQITEQQQQ